MGKGKRDNLIPFSERTEEEQREIRSKGGKRSGEVRRERKALREVYEIVGQKEITITNPDGTKETVILDFAVAIAQYQKAVKGDTKAARHIAEIRGELEKKVSLDGSVQGLTVTVTNPDTAEKLEKILK
jgi:hypothetical protein